MFKNKKWIFFLIVIFPSLFWVILETSTINSKKLPIYGPRSFKDGDSVYYSVNTEFETVDSIRKALIIDTTNYPVIALMFVRDEYKKDAYRISGFWEYVNYKKEKINHIPFILVCEKNKGVSITTNEIKQMSKNDENIHFVYWNTNSFDSLNTVFFRDKPYYIDYSFFMLLDKKRQVRGYYDGRYVAEIKRLISEYQHLRLKEEKQKILKDNEIKTK
ncbi:MAG: hypothetical protein ACK50A_07645 [Sphingobacteriaceae bacterium]